MDGAQGSVELTQDVTFERYARMVRRSLQVPVALVSVFEESRQVVPGAVEVPAPRRSGPGTAPHVSTPLSRVLHRHVVPGRPFVVDDARVDDRVRDDLAAVDDVVACAGWPLTDHRGEVIGALLALSASPRSWTDIELEELADLAASCSSEIAEGQLRRIAGDRLTAARRATRRNRALLTLSESLSQTLLITDISAAVGRVSREELGCLRAELWLRTLDDPTRAAPPVPRRHARDAELLHRVDTAGAVPPAVLHDESALPVVDAHPVGAAILRGRPMFSLTRPEAYLPLVTGQQVYGTLELVWPDGHSLTGDDQATVTALAAYTAQAVERALLLAERVEVAVTLQSAMLPDVPQHDHLSIRARYRPAASRDQVGGDWYDATVLKDGVTVLTIGDVVGHDMSAAAAMGRTQHMLRALAWALPSSGPADVVSHLDQACHDLDHEVLATLLHARIEQSTEQQARGAHGLRWTNAGHCAPVLVHPGGAVELLDVDKPDLMLGVAPELARHDHRCELPAGSTLLLFTDGLVERRGESLSDGIDRLLVAAARLASRELDSFADELLDELLPGRPDDDIALLAVRVPTCGPAPA